MTTPTQQHVAGVAKVSNPARYYLVSRLFPQDAPVPLAVGDNVLGRALLRAGDTRLPRRAAILRLPEDDGTPPTVESCGRVCWVRSRGEQSERGLFFGGPLRLSPGGGHTLILAKGTFEWTMIPRDALGRESAERRRTGGDAEERLEEVRREAEQLRVEVREAETVRRERDALQREADRSRQEADRSRQEADRSRQEAESLRREVARLAAAGRGVQEQERAAAGLQRRADDLDSDNRRLTAAADKHAQAHKELQQRNDALRDEIARLTGVDCERSIRLTQAEERCRLLEDKLERMVESADEQLKQNARLEAELRAATSSRAALSPPSKRARTECSPSQMQATLPLTAEAPCPEPTAADRNALFGLLDGLERDAADCASARRRSGGGAEMRQWSGGPDTVDRRSRVPRKVFAGSNCPPPVLRPEATDRTPAPAPTRGVPTDAVALAMPPSFDEPASQVVGWAGDGHW